MPDHPDTPPRPRPSGTRRFSFMIDDNLLSRLQAVQARTGLPIAEQIREGIRWWLEARQWPDRDHRSVG